MRRLDEDRDGREDPPAAEDEAERRDPARRRDPLRRCIVTGRSRPQSAMLRFVVGPDDAVVPDVDARLPGRGFWLSAGRDVVETAAVKKHFSKAARRGVTVPADLAERVDHLLVSRFLGLLGLARRAGEVVSGFEKVSAELKAGRVGLLVEASDGAAGGREKIERLGRELPVVDLLRSTELGPVLGRDDAVHIAIRAGRLAESLLSEAVRLAVYRGVPVPGDKPRAADERQS